ncbi:MAG: TonB-dependent receptor [Psychrobium sp.]
MKANVLKLSLLATTITSLFSGVAVAKQATAADDKSIENVIVIGSYEGAKPANLAGSYEIIGRDQLDYLHVDNNVELFTKLPGISLSRYNQGPINADLAIRGFDADGTTPHAKLLIDGIPSNLHNGFGELEQVFSSNIDSIQVFKGTSDVKHGLFNIAGNYSVFTRQDTDVKELQTTLGSYGSKELQGYAGFETGKLTHNYSLGFREAEGYRDNSELERYAFNGRWFYQLNNHLKLGYIARFSHFDADAPGYLNRDVARDKPKTSASYASQDGGDKTVVHHSVHANYDNGDFQVDGRVFHQSFERERWVRFSEAGSLTNRYDDQTHTGFLVDARYRIDQSWSVLTGVSYQSEDVLEQRFGTIGQTRKRDVTKVSRNYDYTLDSLGVYASIENQLSDNFKWNLGLRGDKLDGDLTATSAEGVSSDRDIYDFGWIVQPKLNVFYNVNADWLLFANFGESFQHPRGSALYTAGDVNARDVSTNVGWEFGTQVAVAENATLRISHWQQTAEDEYISVDGVAQNVGETERSGWEFAGTWQVNDSVELWANYGVVDTEIVNTSSTNAANVGNQLRSIPEYTASIGLIADVTDVLTARVHVDMQGDYYVNEANLGGKFGGYTIANASFDYDAQWAKLSLNLNNLFDEYSEYVFDFSKDGSATIHSPGDGRNFSVTAKFEF